MLAEQILVLRVSSVRSGWENGTCAFVPRLAPSAALTCLLISCGCSQARAETTWSARCTCHTHAICSPAAAPCRPLSTAAIDITVVTSCHQVNTAVVGITPEVDEFDQYTPFNKPASIRDVLRALPDDDRSSPCAEPPALVAQSQAPLTCSPSPSPPHKQLLGPSRPRLHRHASVYSRWQVLNHVCSQPAPSSLHICCCMILTRLRNCSPLFQRPRRKRARRSSAAAQRLRHRQARATSCAAIVSPLSPHTISICC